MIIILTKYYVYSYMWVMVVFSHNLKIYKTWHMHLFNSVKKMLMLELYCFEDLHNFKRWIILPAAVTIRQVFGCSLPLLPPV